MIATILAQNVNPTGELGLSFCLLNQCGLISHNIAATFTSTAPGILYTAFALVAFTGLMMSTQITDDETTTESATHPDTDRDAADNTTVGSSLEEAAHLEQEEKESGETGNKEGDATEDRLTINPIV